MSLPPLSGVGPLLGITLASLSFSTYQAITIGSSLRRAANITYPTLYASEEQANSDPNVFVYNCAQRAHANYLENLPVFMGAMWIGGLVYPRVSATIGVGWLVFRFVYWRTYVRAKKGDFEDWAPPPGAIGTAFWLWQYAMLGVAGTAVFKVWGKSA